MDEHITITNAHRSELGEVVTNAARRIDADHLYNAGFIDGVTQALDIIDVRIVGVNVTNIEGRR